MLDENLRNRRQSLVEMWSSMPIGVRPPDSDINIYKEAIFSITSQPDATVLLLGSTPELRDLILHLRLKLTGCDIDADFWWAMSDLLAIPGKEEFIHANWLDLESDRQYDFILGDGSLNMLVWEEIQRLLSKLYMILNKNGRMILRVQSANEKLTMGTLSQAISDYPKTRTDRQFLWYLHCLTESLRNTFYPDKSRRDFYESVVSEYLTAEEMDSLRPMLRDRKNCYPNHDALHNLLSQKFDILQCKPSTAPSWGTAHIYTLKKC